ncbi:MAG: mannose-1-phosphate guanylyltransferase/mannose-6-phosphate isomerase, partial [Deltaproteobacteria bacterium RBG_13_47_9]
SLLHSTIERLLPKIPQSRLAVVSIASQADVIRLELHRSGWHDIQLWLEPLGRDTAPAVGLAALLMGNEANSEIMAVFPTDHAIKNPEALYSAIDQGATLAQAGYLVTFGIITTKPDTNHSYIKAEDLIDNQKYGYHSDQFLERPGSARSIYLLHEDGYYWNSGIFMFRRDVFLEAFARYLPSLYTALARSVSKGLDQSQSLVDVYQNLPNISLHDGIMERATNAAVVPVDLTWGDLDDWDDIYELFPKDEKGNIMVGKTLDLDSRNSFVFSPNRLAATIGLEDVVVVDSPDALLVCHRNRVQEVEKIVAELSQRQMVESVQHSTVERPWGNYTIIDSGPGYQVKHIVVEPGERLSLQLHRHRAEYWVVVQGLALVTIGIDRRLLVRNQSVFIPVETVHRLENPGSEAVWLIEVQTGSYLGEDDIVRLADDYWRSSKESMN